MSHAEPLGQGLVEKQDQLSRSIRSRAHLVERQETKRADEFVDQTFSEIRLHRILYLLKFFRAMILYDVAIIVAILIYLTMGIHGIYPPADQLIEGFTMLQSIASTGFVIYVSLFTVLILILVFICLYISIINIKKKALRFFSAFFCVCGLFTYLQYWPTLSYSVSNLSPFFAILAITNFIFLTISSTYFTVDFWRVSNTKDNSAFLATLDRRLAPSAWTYFNKLVDLPRTPFRNWKVLLAYVLSLFGALLLLTSVAYLLTFGGIFTKSEYLQLTCNVKNRAMCQEQSWLWTKEIALGLIASAIGLKSGALIQSIAKKLGGLSAGEILTINNKFTLYLRSFGSDDIVLPKPRLPLLSRIMSFRPFPIHLEEELFDVADGCQPLVAVGNPMGQRRFSAGVGYREYLDDHHWQTYVADKIQKADNIVIVLRNTEGVRWELAKVIEMDAITKTLFLFDPAGRNGDVWDSIKESVLPILATAVPFINFTFHCQALGFFVRNHSIVEIFNGNWSATSYRTVFSAFLAERVATAKSL
jgi:hypothetical protein